MHIFMLALVGGLIATFDIPSMLPRTEASVPRDMDKPKRQVEAMQLLTVPFYTYERIIWHNATVAGKALDDFIADSNYIKHFDDYYFVKAALKHPMRVPNPEQAKLFVVRTLNNVVFNADLSKHRICVKDNCGRHEIVRRAASFLDGSTWFQRFGGRDHVVVSSHYKSRDNTEEACNAITFEDTRICNNDRLNIPHFYGSLPCPLEHNKTHNFAMVGNMHTER